MLPFIGYAQSLHNPQNDSLKIYKTSEYITVKLSLSSDVRGFISENKGLYKYDIEPNSKNVLRASFNYRWLSLSAATTAKFLPGNNDDILKGKTTSTSYSVNLSFKHFQQYIYYNRLKGFYLANTADYQPGWRLGLDAYIQLPNLIYSGFEGRTGYKFNQNFSLAAINTQTERQVKSAGTFMPYISYRYYSINDKTPLTTQNSSQQSNNVEMVFSIAYLHTLVLNHTMYFSAGLEPGIGFIHTKLFTRTIDEEIISRSNAPVVQLEVPLSIGFNSKRFFVGAQYNAEANSYKQGHTANVIVNNHSSYQLFIGYHFNASEKFKSIMDEADKKRSKLF